MSRRGVRRWLFQLRGASAAALTVALAFQLSPLAAQQSGSLSVRVSDGTTGEPISSVEFRVFPSGKVVLSDSEGRATVSGLSPGEYRIEVGAFGYAAVERYVILPRAELLIVELQREAIRLEEITVEVENILGMESRRRAIPMRVTVLDSAFLSRETRPLSETLTSANLELEPCPGPHGTTPACVRVSGRWLVPQICVDERRIPGNSFWEIDSYMPRDLHTVEVFQGGDRDRVVVYVLSKRFIARRLEGRSPLSRSLPCYDVTRPGRRD